MHSEEPSLETFFFLRQLLNAKFAKLFCKQIIAHHPLINILNCIFFSEGEKGYTLCHLLKTEETSKEPAAKKSKIQNYLSQKKNQYRILAKRGLISWCCGCICNTPVLRRIICTQDI